MQFPFGRVIYIRSLFFQVPEYEIRTVRSVLPGFPVLQRSLAELFLEFADKILDTVKTAGLGDDIDRCDLVFQEPARLAEFQVVDVFDRGRVQFPAEELHQRITGNLEFVLDGFQVRKTFR